MSGGLITFRQAERMLLRAGFVVLRSPRTHVIYRHPTGQMAVMSGANRPGNTITKAARREVERVIEEATRCSSTGSSPRFRGNGRA